MIYSLSSIANALSALLGLIAFLVFRGHSSFWDGFLLGIAVLGTVNSLAAAAPIGLFCYPKAQFFRLTPWVTLVVEQPLHLGQIVREFSEDSPDLVLRIPKKVATLRTDFKSSSILVLALLLFLPAAASAQYAVVDAGTEALLSQGNANFLNQMATQLNTLNQQVNQLTTIQTQATQLVTLAGNPAQALSSFASGSMGINPTALMGTFKSISSIASGVSGQNALSFTGGGVFKAIPTALSDGTAIVHDLTNFTKFDAFNQNFQNLSTTLTTTQQQRQTLLQQLQTVMNTSATNQAQQSEKIARINGLAAQLYANDQTTRDAENQTQAQAEANKQDTEKQAQAEQDAENTELQQLQGQAVSARQSFLQQSTN